MGRYFGLVNMTKHQRVSGYWKGAPPSDEMAVIIVQLEWSYGDDVYTCCYDTSYKWDWKQSDWEYKDEEYEVDEQEVDEQEVDEQEVDEQEVDEQEVDEQEVDEQDG